MEPNFPLEQKILPSILVKLKRKLRLSDHLLCKISLARKMPLLQIRLKSVSKYASHPWYQIQPRVKIFVNKLNWRAFSRVDSNCGHSIILQNAKPTFGSDSCVYRCDDFGNWNAEEITSLWMLLSNAVFDYFSLMHRKEQSRRFSRGVIWW